MKPDRLEWHLRGATLTVALGVLLTLLSILMSGCATLVDAVSSPEYQREIERECCRHGCGHHHEGER